MENNWRELVSQPKYGIKEERNEYVPMRDGVSLSVNIFRPDAKGKFPALLALSPYGKELQECLIPPQPISKSPIWDGVIEAGEISQIVSRGYVHVIGDVRGTGDSEGEYLGYFNKQEGPDGYDVVEWLAKQPWCDGNIGMIGYSYYGIIQFGIAAEQPPHLKAICPAGFHIDYYRATYDGGVLSLFPYGLWDGRHGSSGVARKNAVSEMIKTLSKEDLEHRVQELLNNPDIKHYPNLYHLLHYPYKNPIFFDILLNPYDGPFWWDRSPYRSFDKIKVPVYIIGKCGGGQFSTFWDVYNQIDVPKKMLVKPYGPEERPWREDLEEIIRWYDHWLKGIDTGIMEEPPIKMFIPGSNEWRFEKEWPLSGVELTKCYLRRWEGLSFAPELDQYEPDCFLQQPLHLSNKRDSVIYMSSPLSTPLEVIGHAALYFFASIDQDDTNWIVSLFDVAPTGLETRVGKGYLKASHRALDNSKSKPGQPYHPHTGLEPIIPGKIYGYVVSLGVITNVFQPGHRIKLAIESMESPRDPEFQIHYHPHLCSSKTTLHKIYRNAEHQSHLLLPVNLRNQALPVSMSDDNFL